MISTDGRRQSYLAVGIIGAPVLLVILLLFVRAMARPLNHDEHQFIAPAALLLRNGLLPYRDYPVFHTPDLVFVFAGIFALTSHLLLAARGFNAFCAALLLLLVFFVAARAFRHLGERRWLVALGFFLVLGLNRGFDFTAGRAWNHDLAVLASVAAFLAFLRAPHSSRPMIWIAVCGGLVGLSLGTRLSFAPLIVPFALGTLLFPIPGRSRLLCLTSYGVGLALALLPMGLLFLQAPSQFLFDNFTYNGAINRLYRENTVPREIAFLNKLSFPFQEVLKSPSDLAIVAGFGYFALRPWWRSGWRRYQANPAVTLLLLLLPFLFIGSWAPTPSYRQYYYPFVPFLLLGNIHGMARERTFRVGWLLAAVAAESLVQTLLAMPPESVTLHPSKWPVFAAHEEGLKIKRFAPQGRLLTLGPILPLEGGADIYRDFASGPFAWRTATFLDAQQRARYGLVAPTDLEAFLQQKPPAGILTGTEHGKLEQPLKDYARAHHYLPRRINERHIFWSPAKPGTSPVRQSAGLTQRQSLEGLCHPEGGFFLKARQPDGVVITVAKWAQSSDGSRFLPMKACQSLSLVLGLGALFLPACPSTRGRAVAAKEFLVRIRDVPLPGRATRFDYQSFDPTAGRLYLAHMGDGTIVVVDTQAEKVVADVPGFPTVTGVLVVPSVKALYASVAGNHEIVVVDTEKLALTRRIPDGKFPDGLAYSPETGKVFVSDESGGVETVIDVRTNERVDTIKMGGEVGNTQYDPASHLVFACVQTRNELVEINPQTDKIQARYPLPGSDHPHGFYIDAAHRKAYIACEGNNKLIVFNMQTHLVEAVFPVGEGPDVLAFDRGLQLLYVACESGVVSAFQYGNNQLRKIGDLEVGPNSHSVSVDPNTHKVYFPLKNVKGRPLLRIMAPAASSRNQ